MATKAKPMKMQEVADSIGEFLSRFESDPEINKTSGESKLSPYYCAHCWTAGSRIGIRYISFQCDNFLTKSDAIEYLQWLEAGNVGKHWTALSFNTRIRSLAHGDES